MGLLDSFEKGLERAVNGAFAKTFRSGVQPVEVAAALRAEMDKKSAVVSRERILVPHAFTVRLAPSDDDRMRALGPTLLGELTDIVKKHAAAQRYSFAGPVSVTLQRDERLSTGTLRVDSGTSAGTVTWEAVLDVGAKRHRIAGGRTVIGRGSDADLTLSDAGSSRRHAEVLWDGERAVVRDLGSTNGTKLNGQKVTQAPLTSGSVISIGRTDIVFRVTARQAPPVPTISAQDAATRLFDQNGRIR